MKTAKTRHSPFTRAIQLDLMTLVAGAALILELVVTLPGDLRRFSPSDWDGAYTTLLFAKYACLLWFATYFFLGKVRREGAKERGEAISGSELGFDIFQVGATVIAAWFLGFFSHPVDPPNRDGFVVAAVSILLISVVSMVLFRDNDAMETPPTLQHVRLIGAAVSLLAIIAFVIAQEGTPLAACAALFFVIHAVLLARFAVLMVGRERRAK